MKLFENSSTLGVVLLIFGILFIVFAEDYAYFFPADGRFAPQTIRITGGLLLVYGITFSWIALRRFAKDSLDRRSQGLGAGGEDSGPEGGFVFFEMDEEKKRFFRSVMEGFEDYAKLKGYSVSFSIETSKPNYVGIKFTILDEGVTVATQRVKDDIDEYVSRFSQDKSFSKENIGSIAVSEIASEELIARLNMRIKTLEHEVELSKVAKTTYYKLLQQIQNYQYPKVSHQSGYPSQNVTLVVGDQPEMSGDSYHQSNSPFANQGKRNTQKIAGSTISIGSMPPAAEVVTGIDQIVELLKSSGIENKQQFIDSLEMVKSEMARGADANHGLIEGLLAKTTELLGIAEQGTELYERIEGLLASFGLG